MFFHFGSLSGGEPTPVITITLLDETTGLAIANLTALVDTGADGTLVPLKILQDAGFNPNRQRKRFYTAQPGQPFEMVSGYSVLLQIGGFELSDVDVYASRTITDIILGRDVLNRLIFTYDGPQKVLEIINLD